MSNFYNYNINYGGLFLSPYAPVPSINNNYFTHFSVAQPSNTMNKESQSVRQQHTIKQQASKPPFSFNKFAKPFIPNNLKPHVQTNVVSQTVNKIDEAAVLIQKKTEPSTQEIIKQFDSLSISQPKKQNSEKRINYHSLSLFNSSSIDQIGEHREKNDIKTETSKSSALWKGFDKQSFSQPLVLTKIVPKKFVKKNDLVITRVHQTMDKDTADRFNELDFAYSKRMATSEPLYQGPTPQETDLLERQLSLCQTLNDLVNIWEQQRAQFNPNHYIKLLNQCVAIQRYHRSNPNPNPIPDRYNYMVTNATSHCIDITKNLNGHCLAMFVNAATKLCRTDPECCELITKIDKELSKNGYKAIAECDNYKSLAIIAQACGRAGSFIDSSEVFRAIEHRLLNNDSEIVLFYNNDHTIFPKSLRREVARLSNGFGNGQIDNEKVFKSFATILLRNNGHVLKQRVDPRELAMIIQGFCSQELFDSRPLFKTINDSIFDENNKLSLNFNEIEFTMIVSGIMEASYISEKNRKDLYGCSNLISELILHLHNQANNNIVIEEGVLLTCKNLQFAYPRHTEKWIQNGTALQKQMDEYVEQLQNARFKEQQVMVSRSQKRLATHLKKNYIQEFYIAGSGFVVDFCDPNKKHIIEFDGEQHFYNNNRKVQTIHTKFKIQLFTNKGYKMTNICHWEWPLDERKQRKQVIKDAGKDAVKSQKLWVNK